VGAFLFASSCVHTEWYDRSEEVYQYEALYPNVKSVRFLHLQPGAKDDPVSIKLVACPLAELPPFEALSYTWGNTVIPKIIACNGLSFKIHLNAWHALVDLRYEDKPRVLWVDAICINQQDNEDKNHYVPMMRVIYERASRVCVWMQPVHVDMANVLNIVSKVSAIGEKDELEPEKSLLAVTAADLTAQGLPSVNDPVWKSIDLLLWSSWFNRIWIIQEITLARDAILVSGSASCPWEHLKRAAHYIADHGLTALLDVDPSQVLRLESMKKIFDDGTPVLDLAQIARSSKATNHQDKIYGLLGLASDGAEFTPDYSARAVVVYRDIALQMIENDQSLAVLNSVEHWGDFGAGQAKAFGELPTWAPNWTLYGLAQPFPETAQLDHSDLVMAVNSEKTHLQVQGLEVDKVKDASETFIEFVPQVGNSVQEMVGINSVMNGYHGRRWRAWNNMANKVAVYPSGEDPRSAYIRCLVADMLPAETKDGEELAAIYEKWLKFWRMVGYDRGKDLGAYLESTPEEDVPIALGFMAAHKAAAYGRRFIVTKEGWFGLAPAKTRSSDSVVALCGGKTLYVLRPKKKGKGEEMEWKVLGECYVHGVQKDILKGRDDYQSFNLR
jgi:hypothetical protein